MGILSPRSAFPYSTGWGESARALIRNANSYLPKVWKKKQNWFHHCFLSGERTLRKKASMRKTISVVLILAWLFISSCSSNTPSVTPQVVSVYSTAAAEPWLHELYDCAGTSSILSRVDDPASAEIALRVGEPRPLSSFAYQIDSEDILIVTQRQSPIQNLTLEEAQALFAGQGAPAMQVWVYASGED